MVIWKGVHQLAESRCWSGQCWWRKRSRKSCCTGHSWGEWAREKRCCRHLGKQRNRHYGYVCVCARARAHTRTRAVGTLVHVHVRDGRDLRKRREIWRVSRRKAVASDSREGHTEHKTFPSLCRADPLCLMQWFPSLAKVQKEDRHLPCTTPYRFSTSAVGPRLWSWVLISLFRWDANMLSCSHCATKVSMIVK